MSRTHLWEEFVSVTVVETDNICVLSKHHDVVSTYSMHFVFNHTFILHLSSQALHANSYISLDLFLKFKPQHARKNYIIHTDIVALYWQDPSYFQLE
jgi:hypothetical protein